jgi:hypothetical protein
MIARPNNWDDVQEFSDRPKLPLGAYVCHIRQASIRDNPNSGSQSLAVLFDISEGEYTGFYQKEFMSNPSAERKWKGVLYVWLPRNDGSDKDENSKRTLKGFVTSVERSNAGYTWNWDERSLVGKTVGIIFRNEEWDYNGKHGWSVRPWRATSADKVRNGEYTIPEDKALPTSSTSYGNTSNYGYGKPSFTEEDNEEQLPF